MLHASAERRVARRPRCGWSIYHKRVLMADQPSLYFSVKEWLKKRFSLFYRLQMASGKAMGGRGGILLLAPVCPGSFRT